MYQNQTPGNVSMRKLSPERGGHPSVCQRGPWGPKGVRLGGFHIDWRGGTSVSKDARPRRGWIVRSHIGWRGERNILYKDVGTSLADAFKTSRASLKRTISGNSEIGLLQM